MYFHILSRDGHGWHRSCRGQKTRDKLSLGDSLLPSHANGYGGWQYLAQVRGLCNGHRTEGGSHVTLRCYPYLGSAVSDDRALPRSPPSRSRRQSTPC